MYSERQMVSSFIRKLIWDGGYAAAVLSEQEHERLDFESKLLTFVETVAQEFYDKGYDEGYKYGSEDAK